MTHSLYVEDRNIIYFHGQLVVDWNTVIEIAERFLRQFELGNTSLDRRG
jgi:hypothetical protein